MRFVWIANFRGKGANKEKLLLILLRKIKSFLRICKYCGLDTAFRVFVSKIACLVGFKGNKKNRRIWATRKGYSIPPSAFRLTEQEYSKQKEAIFPVKTKFSIIVPLFNTPRPFLQEMIGSVLFQTYQNWELCLADGSDAEHSYVGEICMEIAGTDNRIKYKKLESNYGISGNTNECIKMATGDYISLLDHDDILHPSALYETERAICEKDAELIYTDEAIFESPDLYSIKHIAFKADFFQRLLEISNYICHFTSFKKSVYDGLMFDPECDGAQDYDIVLKLVERTNKIFHIKKRLYYWRSSLSSTAGSSDAKPYTWKAGKLALEKHFRRIGEKATVYFADSPNTYLCVHQSK